MPQAERNTKPLIKPVENNNVNTSTNRERDITSKQEQTHNTAVTQKEDGKKDIKFDQGLGQKQDQGQDLKKDVKKKLRKIKSLLKKIKRAT